MPYNRSIRVKQMNVLDYLFQLFYLLMINIYLLTDTVGDNETKVQFIRCGKSGIKTVDV